MSAEAPLPTTQRLPQARTSLYLPQPPSHYSSNSNSGPPPVSGTSNRMSAYYTPSDMAFPSPTIYNSQVSSSSSPSSPSFTSFNRQQRPQEQPQFRQQSAPSPLVLSPTPTSQQARHSFHEGGYTAAQLRLPPSPKRPTRSPTQSSFERTGSPLSNIVTTVSKQLAPTTTTVPSTAAALASAVSSPDISRRPMDGELRNSVINQQHQRSLSSTSSIVTPQLSVSIAPFASPSSSSSPASPGGSLPVVSGVKQTSFGGQISTPPGSIPSAVQQQRQSYLQPRQQQLVPSAGSRTTLGSSSSTLPILSPISPLEASALAYTLNNDTTNTTTSTRDISSSPTPISNTATLIPSIPLATTPPPADVDADDDIKSWAVPPSPLSDPGSVDGSVRRGSVGKSAARVLSQVLQIQVPTHSSPKKSSFDLDSPRLRDSSSIPRRRTIVVEGPDVALQSSPVQVSTSTDDYAQQQPHLQASLHRVLSAQPDQEDHKTHSEVFEFDRVSTPVSPSKRPTDPNAPLTRSPAEAVTRPLSVSTASAQIKNDGAGHSPRSLPQPPSNNDRYSMAAVEAIPMPVPMPAAHPSRASTLLTSPVSPASPRSQRVALATNGGIASSLSPKEASIPIPLPMPSPRRATTPDKSRTFATASAAAARPDSSQQQKSATMQAPVPVPFNSRHQPTNSASNLPAIAGLADAGPYPTAPPPIGGAGGSLAIPGASASGRRIPPAMRQEEVCLECMMRDRDLADVVVAGEGAWERDSDVAWKDLKERERELTKSWNDDALSVSGTSFEDESSEPPSSPRSQANGLPDESQRNSVLRKQHLDARRAERDVQISRVGWRGFSWEEGTNGEGFPRGFRGNKPGALTEKGIKNVMQMYPSSSPLRCLILQNYLHGQHLLLLEIRAQAKRVGHYAAPEEPYYPTSPTIPNSDSDVPTIANKPRRLAQRSMDLGASSIKSPSISTARSAPVVPAPSAPALRQSPSTPAGLGSQVTHRSRPKTYYSDREPPLPTSPNLSAVPLAQQPQANRASHYKVPSGGSTIPKGRDSRFLSADDWSDTEDLWAPASPASGNLRPFSFAVRAGAGGNGSESSHNRRSFFGRFGGSVTSLFTGHTHGGSGSMMDMHLGLESDRRNRTSSYQTHEAPRVQTSLSPSRAPYSRQSSMYFAHQDEQPGSATPTTASAAAERPRSRSRSVSGSRLTQVSLFDDVDDEPAKKKGFKGLLQKMKGGSKTKRDRASTLVGINISPRPDEDVTQLAPPPPMAYLVNHNRQRSGSSSTVDDQSTPALSPQTATTASGARSVSAPMGTSSSGSISPTSSRFQGDRQDSQAPPRRRGEPALELPPGAADSAFQQRNSVMEMLSGSTASGVNAPVTPDTPVYDEPQQFGARESVMIPNGQPGQHPQHPQVPAGYRKTKQSSLSSRYSTSTTTVPLETPDQSASALYLVPHQQSSPPNHTSRQKTLPPLPPPGVGVFPDMYIDHEPQSSYTSRGSMYSAHTGASYPRASMMEPRLSTIDPRMSYVDPRSSMYDSPTVHRAALPPSADYFPTASGRHHAASPVNVAPDYVAPPKALGRTVQPRASFDMLNRRHGSNNSASMAMSNDDLEPPQGMYMQRGAAASTGSFGRFLKGNDAARNTVMNSVPQTEDKKERRRGIKSIFGKRA